MTKKTTLECSHDQLHALHVAVDKARKGSTTIRVDRAALDALLKDQLKLINLHKHELDGVL